MAMFAPRLPATGEAFDAALDPSSPIDVRLAAARDVADRIFGKPLIRSQSQVQVAALVKVVFED